MNELRKHMALAYASKMGEQLALLPVEKQLVQVETLRSVLDAITAEREYKIQVFNTPQAATAADAVNKMREVVDQAFGSMRLNGGVMSMAGGQVGYTLTDADREEVREFKKLLHKLNQLVHAAPGNQDKLWASIRVHYNNHLKGDGNPATSLVSLYLKASPKNRDNAMRCLRSRVEVVERSRKSETPKAMAAPEFHVILVRLFSRLDRTRNLKVKEVLRGKLRKALGMVTSRRSVLAICEAYGASDNATRLRAMHHVLRYTKHFSK